MNEAIHTTNPHHVGPSPSVRFLAYGQIRCYVKRYYM